MTDGRRLGSVAPLLLAAAAGVGVELVVAQATGRRLRGPARSRTP